MLITTQIVNGAIAHEGLSSFEGKTVLCEVVKWYPKRSIQSNKFYWAILNETIRQVSEYTGYTVNELHKAFKLMFLSEETLNVLTGQIEKSIRSTADLNSQEFSEYANKVIQYCSENFGIEYKLD
jgi:hypothetical protein